MRVWSAWNGSCTAAGGQLLVRIPRFLPLRLLFVVVWTVVVWDPNPGSAYVQQYLLITARPPLSLSAYRPPRAINPTTTTGCPTTKQLPCVVAMQVTDSKKDDNSPKSSSNNNNTTLPNMQLLLPEVPVNDMPQEPQDMAKTTGDIFIDPIVVWGDDKDNSNDSMGDNNNNSIDTRFLFPEYASGAVPRLFSTLQYQSTTSPTPTTTSSSRPVVVVATHATGSVGAAAALVTGTTVGAGILALPAATAPAGFLPSSVALIFGYGIMTVSGLLLAELLLNRWGQTGKPDSTGIMDLYNNNNNGATSPSVGSMAVAQLSRMAYFFLHYALMVAYIAQGGSLVSNAVSNVWLSDVISATVTLPPVLLHLGRDAVLGPILFTATMGTTLFVSNKTTMQQLNNALVTGVFATFVGTLVVSAAAVQESTTTTLSSSYSTLWDPANLHPNELWNALPVIFLAFVFHNIIPVIVKDLEGDRTKIAQAILLGSVIPLGMFLAWNAMVLAILPSDITAATAATIDPIALFQQNTDGNYGALLTGFVTSFSMLAIVTSLIGFTYGLLDAWADFLKLDSVSLGQRKLQLFGLIFLPPLAFALANPDVFQTALEYGGAFGVSTLFLLLPPIMVWKERYGDQQSPLVTKPLVPFGKFPLVILVMVSVTLILQQAAEKAGFY